MNILPAQTQKKQKPTKSSGSSQKFTEVENIIDDIVMLHGGNACLVIHVRANNFALLSKEEQDAKIYAYASFLNSLSFPIQIIVRNKKIDISSYINLLTEQCKISSPLHAALSEEQNKALVTQIEMYRDFVQELVKVNVVLDKEFYIVIPYSSLEQGVTGASQAVKGSGKQSFIDTAKAALHTKADSVHGQLSRLSLHAKTLQQEELTRLFYSVFNQEISPSGEIATSVNVPVIKTNIGV
jgi:sensor histidine kinase YesM